MRQTDRIAVPAIGILGLVAIAVLAWNAEGPSRSTVLASGSIRIGYAVEAPYAFVKSGGEVTGESPEVARHIVAQLGIQRVEWVQTEFDHLIPDLELDRFDLVAAGLFITPGRARDVAFSEPTFHVGQGLLVRSGNPRQLHSYADAVAARDVKLAVVEGAVEEGLVRRLGAVPGQLLPVPDALTGRVAVDSGVVDGLALSSITIRWMALHGAGQSLEAAEPFTPPDPDSTGRLGYGAFAFRKGDAELLAAWNAALRSFIGSPEHLALIAPFGFTAAELPGLLSTKEILQE
jgi:polar amino acid transport system substrate-binding protein